ncbi:hypothetical protein HYX14_04155 [Candidatus Woesearchaeota archaeon]|nr:hypothetical protein [Candidatus Woesearchaeota archaeon]
MKRVIIDTNAILAIAQFKIDVFSELDIIMNVPYTIYILDETVQELKKIIENGKNRPAAKLGLALLKAKKVGILSEEGYVDDLLAAHSQQGDLILTQDVALKKRLQRPYLTIRQKRKIIIVS